MVVGCDWSATGCRYSVTVALASVRTHMYALYMFVYCGSVRRDHVHTLNTHSVYVL